MSAAAPVWALVSGFPGEKRRKRWLGMFQAFMDESVGDKTVGHRLFVMGGYIATAEAWAEFSDEWQRLLEMASPAYRKLDSFHLVEMNSEADKERIEWFYRVIEQRVQAAITMVIDMRAIDSVFAEFAWPPGYAEDNFLKNPYSIAFQQILGGIPQGMERAGINSPIDFFFDDTSNKVDCLRGWEIMRATAPPEVLPLMGETPAFRDDKRTLPLQAADLWAGLTRRWGEKVLPEDFSGKIPPHPIPWTIKRSYPVMSLYFGQDAIRLRYQRIFDSLVARIASRASLKPSSPGQSS